jgi:hypothetical protein
MIKPPENLMWMKLRVKFYFVMQKNASIILYLIGKKGEKTEKGTDLFLF